MLTQKQLTTLSGIVGHKIDEEAISDIALFDELVVIDRLLDEQIKQHALATLGLLLDSTSCVDIVSAVSKMEPGFQYLADIEIKRTEVKL